MSNNVTVSTAALSQIIDIAVARSIEKRISEIQNVSPEVVDLVVKKVDEAVEKYVSDMVGGVK